MEASTEQVVELVDFEGLAKECPDRYHHLPTRTEKICIRPGIYCRVQFSTGERAWVEVRSREGDRRFLGRLDTQPASVPLKRGDLIPFGLWHVCEVA